MIRQVSVPSITLLIAIFTLVTGVVFPLAFTAAGSLALPFEAGGSLVERDGKIIGSALLGQDFEAPRYFHGRPSALMGADPKDSSRQIPTPYDASESGASNLAPTSKSLIDRVTAAVASAGARPAPADAVHHLRLRPGPGHFAAKTPPPRSPGSPPPDACPRPSSSPWSTAAPRAASWASSASPTSVC